MTNPETGAGNLAVADAVEEKTAAAAPLPEVDLDDPKYFINRELSWLEFNRRVLEEALDDSNPLLERVKFLSIFSSNLDEFFMIRVSGLQRQLAGGALHAPPDGMTPAEQLAGIAQKLEPMLEQRTQCWSEDLLPKLRKEKIFVHHYDEFAPAQRDLLRRHFEEEIFPALTPLAFDPGHPFPHISNLSINLAVVLQDSAIEDTSIEAEPTGDKTAGDPDDGKRFARLKVPQIFPRLLRVPSEAQAKKARRLSDLGTGKSTYFVWLEEVVAANMDLLFPGVESIEAFPFRVTRDADFEIEEDEASDLLSTMEEVVGKRHFGFAVRLEVDRRMPERVRDILVENLKLSRHRATEVEGPIGMSDVMRLLELDRPELKDPPFIPAVPRALAGEKKIFSVLKRRNMLLYHPYDSFTPVVDFLRQASADPDVLAIKQTLYRVGPDSPIVEILKDARENGKQVAVLVELKARFDETNNIVWARELERAGVHVVYGVLGLKTHAKMCLVVRREGDGIRRYVHLGTGNYNPVTARIYTDLAYFTCDPEIAADVSELFNKLTGYSRQESFRKLLVAPALMRQGILDRIEREIRRHEEHGDGRLVFKMNALVDKACIQALYRASRAGVEIDLQVRGICGLRPGIPGLSETIHVTSIVGRFLEHPRIYYFGNGGDDEILIGSADLMPRNLDGRVETLVPIVDPQLARALRDGILFLHLRDNLQARELQADGTWIRREPAKDEKPLDTQHFLLENRSGWHFEE